MQTTCWHAQALGRIRGLAKVDSSSVSVSSVSFLLDDDSTLPFVSKDILAQMDDKVTARRSQECMQWRCHS